MSRPRAKSIAALKDELRQRDLLDVAERTAKEHHVLVEEMLDIEDQTTPSARARHAFWTYLKSTGFWSYPRIAGLCGVKDHTTVLLAVRRYRKRTSPPAGTAAPSTPPVPGLIR